MRLRLCCVLLVLGFGSLACSSNSTKTKANNPAQSTDTSTNTNTNTNTNTDTDAGDAGGNNANCPAWPTEKLAPMIGPFFYGTDPRPCRVDIGSSHLFYGWDPNSGRVTQVQNVAGGETTIYTYDDNGFIVSSAPSPVTKSSTTMTYEYAADATTWKTTDSSGAVTTIVYKLDAQGYPQVATINPAPAGQPVRFVHQYDNCQLVKRVAYNADGTVNDSLSADYNYDSQGRVIERNAPSDDEVIVYDTGC